MLAASDHRCLFSGISGCTQKGRQFPFEMGLGWDACLVHHAVVCLLVLDLKVFDDGWVHSLQSFESGQSTSDKGLQFIDAFVLHLLARAVALY